jgi:hypothetical protein
MKNILQNETLLTPINGYSQNPSIQLGNYSLSIQYGEYLYCSPKQNLPPTKYTSVELAIFHGLENIEKSHEKGVKQEEFESFKHFKFLQSFRTDSDNFAYFGYVPVELVDDLYLYLLDLTFENKLKKLNNS